MSGTRPMVHAGTFYPHSPDILRPLIARHLNRARSSFGAPRAILAPHAGWAYCAPVMATAFRAVAGLEGIKRLLLVGPSHYEPVSGIVTSDADAFEMPFGTVPVDRAALDGVAVDAKAHAREHALEVHLPFLHSLFPECPIVPLLVGDAAPEDVAGHLSAAGCGEEGVLTVISSDLAHYLPVDRLQATDRDTLRRIEAGDYVAVDTTRACAAPALQGFGILAQRFGWNATALDRSDSCSITGENPHNAVGYAAIGWYGGDTETGL